MLLHAPQPRLMREVARREAAQQLRRRGERPPQRRAGAQVPLLMGAVADEVRRPGGVVRLHGDDDPEGYKHVAGRVSRWKVKCEV